MNRIINNSHCKTSRIIDLQEKVGFTGYIDFMVVSDFMEYEDTIIGVDVYNRPFLSFKVLANNSLQVGSFFRRYTDSNSVAYGTCYGCNLWNDSRIRNTNEENLVIDRLTKLKLGETLNIENVTYRFIGIRKNIQDILDFHNIKDISKLIMEYL